MIDFGELRTMDSDAGTVSHNVLQRWDCYTMKKMWGRFGGAAVKGLKGIMIHGRSVCEGQRTLTGGSSH
jgi:hypothetical protein